MNFLSTKINFENLSLITSIGSCLFMASFYVISLYLWSKQNRYNRNDPSVMKRRFLSVILSSILSLVFIYLLSKDENQFLKNQFNNSILSINNLSTENHFLHEWIGFRLDPISLVKSVTVALFLTMVLFSGPIVQHFVSQYYFSLSIKLYEHTVRNVDQLNVSSDKNNNKRNVNRKYSCSTKTIHDLNTIENFQSYLKISLKSCFSDFKFEDVRKNVTDLCFLRNYVVSSFTEEFVFRSCMLPLLMPHLNFTKSILTTPLFFGMAHLHHIIEGLKMKDESLQVLLVRHLFQFTYTYVFGVYSSYLFLRTGNFFSSFLSHSFCNLMGFPNIGELINDFKGNTRRFICFMYFIGFISFFCLISTLTNPIYFDNKVYSHS